MSDITDSALKTKLDTNINTNGLQSITGAVHNDFLTDMIDSKANNDDIGTRTYTEDNVVTDSESVTSSIDELDKIVGDQTYTEQNNVTNGQDLTDSIDALDQAIGKFGTMQSVKVSLTAGEVGTLGASPVTLIAAPAADKAIVVTSIAWFMDVTTALEVGSQDLYVEYNGGSPVGTITNSIVENGSDVYQVVDDDRTVNITRNAAIQARLSSSTNPISGNVTMFFDVLYRIVSG